MKTRGKKSVQVVSTANIASAPSTSQSQLVTYPNSGHLIDINDLFWLDVFKASDPRRSCDSCQISQICKTQ